MQKELRNGLKMPDRMLDQEPAEKLDRNSGNLFRFLSLNGLDAPLPGTGPDRQGGMYAGSIDGSMPIRRFDRLAGSGGWALDPTARITRKPNAISAPGDEIGQRFGHRE